MYQIPKSPSIHTEINVKKSRFIAYAMHVSSPKAAKKSLTHLKHQHPDANHICYAYSAGRPHGPQTSYSDDGEPSGKAGKPIWQVVHYSEVGEILIAVVRYFGGTKLGTGGLSRAYADAAKAVFAELETTSKTQTITLTKTISFADEALFRKQLEQKGGRILNLDYTHNGVKLCIETVVE